MLACALVEKQKYIATGLHIISVFADQCYAVWWLSCSLACGTVIKEKGFYVSGLLSRPSVQVILGPHTEEGNTEMKHDGIAHAHRAGAQLGRSWWYGQISQEQLAGCCPCGLLIAVPGGRGGAGHPCLCQHQQ